MPPQETARILLPEWMFLQLLWATGAGRPLRVPKPRPKPRNVQHVGEPDQRRVLHPSVAVRKLDSRDVQQRVASPDASPHCSPHSPEAQTCSLPAQLLSVPAALPAPPLSQDPPSLQRAVLCSHPTPPRPREPPAAGGMLVGDGGGSRSGVGVRGSCPSQGGEQTLLCLQGQQRTVGIDTRPSASS